MYTRTNTVDLLPWHHKRFCILRSRIYLGNTDVVVMVTCCRVFSVLFPTLPAVLFGGLQLLPSDFYKIPDTQSFKLFLSLALGGKKKKSCVWICECVR